MSDNDKTPNTDGLSPEEAKRVYDQSLRDEHARMLAAMESEFKGVDPDSEATLANVRARIVELVPDAIERAKFLLHHAESEAVQGKLVQFILAEANKGDKDHVENDPMAKMLEKLREND